MSGLRATDVLPLAEFKAHAPATVDRLRATNQPILLTQNGRPAVVVMSPALFDALTERDRFQTAIGRAP